ncbi:gamma-carbonic anhydrase [Coccomyxa subellipsoidea C-169]|uniref:Gamma-carbonic anhydrase n=1 Tax=Coccomyxa subellipsoidea (strain C-169) TaxID=574566 RepID=I0YP17_COCSC|nr:gamma-carbonic anhydrase [Coccomyxa subellipsoidea C-169]EIE20136.1 gamma-carbonic anhydrase [Coccomyxa subellipsoidea C-169]|eukprot:XP_005644680.1 gamma-carbonic anhydrase [Coccomyxa subellipsoidea C-169]
MSAQKIFKLFGSVARQTGQTLDSIGLKIQGQYGYKEGVPTHQTLQGYLGKRPTLGTGAFVAPNASVIGDVKLGNNSSVWYGAVLRGDVNHIVVGNNTNIQDGVTVHVARHNPQGKVAPTTIGNNVTVGHGAIIHAATVEDNVLVGMGATILDGVTVQKGSVVAAGAVVTPGKTVPSGEVWAGNPAKMLRKLEEEEAGFIAQAANDYAALAAVHAAENGKGMEEILLDNARREDRARRSLDYDSHMGVERDPISREIISTASHT